MCRRIIAMSSVVIMVIGLTSGSFGRDRSSAATSPSDDDNAVYQPDLGISLDGTRIIALLPGSPAARAGLRVGDEIRRLGYEPIDSSQELQAAIAAQRPNSLAEMVVDRQNQRQKVKIWMPSEATTSRRLAPPNQATQPRTTYQSNYAPSLRQTPTPARSNVVAGSLRDEDYVNSGLDTARRRADPSSDVILRSRRGEREMDRAERAFDRNTNRLAEKSGSPQEFDQPYILEPPGYHVVVPGDLSGPRMSQSDRGPEQYYGRPGASQSERGDYPIPGDKGGISHDRTQATAPDALTPDRAGRTSAEDRTTRLVDEFSTHSDRQNGRPDRISGENDPRIHLQRPLTRPAAPGRPWYPDVYGGGTAFPPRYPNRGINPPNEGTNLPYPRDVYSDLNRETTDPYWYDLDED